MRRYACISGGCAERENHEEGFHTWDDILQLLLDNLDQVPDLLSWSSPKDEAIPRIDEVGIFLWSIELREDGVQDPALKIWR